MKIDEIWKRSTIFLEFWQFNFGLLELEQINFGILKSQQFKFGLPELKNINFGILKILAVLFWTSRTGADSFWNSKILALTLDFWNNVGTLECQQFDCGVLWFSFPLNFAALKLEEFHFGCSKLLIVAFLEFRNVQSSNGGYRSSRQYLTNWPTIFFIFSVA